MAQGTFIASYPFDSLRKLRISSRASYADCSGFPEVPTAQNSNTAGPSEPARRAAPIAKNTFYASKDDQIRQLQAQVKEKDDAIIELKQTIQEINAAKKDASLREPSTYSGTRRIGTRMFDVLGSGPNAGKLVTQQWKKIFSNGTWYKEWTALSQIKLEMGNKGKLVEVEKLGDMNFWRVPDGEHQGVYVQVVSEHSLVETQEGKFIKWTLREELPKESRPRI